MTPRLTLYVDGEPLLDVLREGGTPGRLRAWFGRLDADMDDGVEVDGMWIAAPDEQQRRRFVVQQIIGAVAAGRDDLARTLLIYLAFRWPELRSVKLRAAADVWEVELEHG